MKREKEKMGRKVKRKGTSEGPPCNTSFMSSNFTNMSFFGQGTKLECMTDQSSMVHMCSFDRTYFVYEVYI